MEYTRSFFDPAVSEGATTDKRGNVVVPARGTKSEGYVYAPRVILAINLALATRRPLLVSGEPGSGKSSLARNTAAGLGWRYYKRVVTSRTQASDLMWTFDALGRLNDAYTPGTVLQPKQHYVQPGPLWWALSGTTAVNRGSVVIDSRHRAVDRENTVPSPHAVVLVDEIDKADPDVPNDLLDPFDTRSFVVRETDDAISVEASAEVLLILTTNGERELPRAFLRRCVTLRLDEPTDEWFMWIADQRFGSERDGLHAAIASEVMRLRGEARKRGLRPPSTAEYLDAVDACRKLDTTVRAKVWDEVARGLLWKSELPQPPRETEVGA